MFMKIWKGLLWNTFRILIFDSLSLRGSHLELEGLDSLHTVVSVDTMIWLCKFYYFTRVSNAMVSH